MDLRYFLNHKTSLDLKSSCGKHEHISNSSGSPVVEPNQLNNH